jgi:hypothetical protein
LVVNIFIPKFVSYTGWASLEKLLGKP